jgi:Family of unknown function (DUF6441)
MKLVATLARSLQADMQTGLRDIERAVATGTRDAGRGLKTELRRQVASAGLGQRLANSWRDKHYPKRLDVARAAERWSAELPALIEQQLQSD